MAFADLAKKLKLPDGASERYRQLEALGRMLEGKLYDDLPFSFETERMSGGKHIPLRDRRPSTDFNLPWEITQDTLAELFGDEQFPVISVGSFDGPNDDDKASTKRLAILIEELDLPSVMTEAYEEGVVGAVGVVIHETEGMPYYDVLPAKWCQPIYTSQYSNTLLALIVTYPIGIDEVKEKFGADFVEDDENRGETTWWYRYIVGPSTFDDFWPLPDRKYAMLGQKDENNEIIEFKLLATRTHSFTGRVPAVYTRNFGGRRKELDGIALWWPIRNLCVEIDYNLSQAGRGLRYSADPMLFIKKGGDLADDSPGGYEAPGGGMATVTGEDGSMVKGVTQTLIGFGKDADAKLLEIGAQGIKEEREFVKDLREYALEILGGMKARAEHASGPTSGTAIDKNMKPLRRLIRRQRRPYGNHLLIELLQLTIWGMQRGAIEIPSGDKLQLPQNARLWPEWPADDVLQGQDLFYHIEGLQLAAGGSLQAPKELIAPEYIGAKMAGDIGFHEPYDSIKGSGEAPPEPAPTTPTQSGKKAAST